MKRNSIILSILVSLLMIVWPLISSAQTTIAGWSFPTLAAAPNTPTTIPAETGYGTIHLDGTNVFGSHFVHRAGRLCALAEHGEFVAGMEKKKEPWITQITYHSIFSGNSLIVLIRLDVLCNWVRKSFIFS